MKRNLFIVLLFIGLVAISASSMAQRPIPKYTDKATNDKSSTATKTPKPKQKCSVCHLSLAKCRYKGRHPQSPKCSTCGNPKSQCRYQGSHPKCSVCSEVKEKCAYRGNHPICAVCSEVKEHCAYRGNHPTCSVCNKLKDECEFKGNHPTASQMNKWGDDYYNGTNGKSQDYSEAVKWYRKAVEQGNADAQCNLGFCYYFGHGVPQDYSEAAKWFRKAADQGEANAQNNLGNRYYNGEGVPQDYSEAAKWFRKAAEQGKVNAQYILGYCYEHGQGVDEDYNEAKKWYRKATDQGDTDAKSALERLNAFGCPDNNHPHAIDLGLPSGTKWACCNVGASKPEKSGNYYAWGETEKKSDYSWKTYKYGSAKDKLTKYCTKSEYGKGRFTDSRTMLELSDDVARANWGGQWRMPTKSQLDELKDKCSFEDAMLNGVKGCCVTASNGNRIFFPLEGCYDGLVWDWSFVHRSGCYWSSTLYENRPELACYLYFYSDGVGRATTARRYIGCTVRPVCP